MKKWITAAALVSTVGCSSMGTHDAISTRKIASDAPDVTLHVVSTTDVHGYITEQTNKAGLKYGGVDLMAGYFDIARAVDPETLFLDSGDLFQGTIISNTAVGAPVVRWMNFARYDAVAVGNHDFDFGPGDGHVVVVQAGEDPLGALKTRESESKFQYLSANTCAVNEDDGHCSTATNFKTASAFKPYLMKSVHGIHVAIIGLTTTATPETTMSTNVSALRFMPLKETLERYVPLVKSAGADVVLVAMHEGGFCNGKKCNPKDPIFSLIDRLSPEIRAQIPIIFGGHTHGFVNTTYNGVRVTIAGSYGQAFQYSTIVYHPADKSVSVEDSRSYNFCSQVFPDTQRCTQGTGDAIAPTFLGQPVVRNAAAKALIQDDIDRADAAAARVVGKLISPLRKGNGLEATLGDFEADAFRSCFDSSCKSIADIAFQNNGGIRVTSIPAGPVTYGQIFELAPFDNAHSDLSLTGAQVHDLLVSWYEYGENFNQVSGLRIYYDLQNTHPRTMTNAAGESQTLDDPIAKIEMADGSAFDEKQTYHVVMGDFLATGGSGSDFVLKGLRPKINYDRKQRDEIVDFLLTHPAGLDYGDSMPHRLIQQSAAPTSAATAQ